MVGLHPGILKRKRVLVTIQSRRTDQKYERVQTPLRQLAQNNEKTVPILEQFWNNLWDNFLTGFLLISELTSSRM